jgi:hypothetical protein
MAKLWTITTRCQAHGVGKLALSHTLCFVPDQRQSGALPHTIQLVHAASDKDTEGVMLVVRGPPFSFAPKVPHAGHGRFELAHSTPRNTLNLNYQF